jgi:hypothetical protein
MTRDLVDIMGGGKGRAPRHVDDDDAATTVGAENIKLTDLTMVLHYDNPARGAVLVSETGEESKAVWLPKSQIEISSNGKTAKATTTKGKPITLPVVEVTLPIWAASRSMI